MMQRLTTIKQFFQPKKKEIKVLKQFFTVLPDHNKLTLVKKTQKGFYH